MNSNFFFKSAYKQSQRAFHTRTQRAASAFNMNLKSAERTLYQFNL